MYQNFKQKCSVTMEPRDHFKNGASLKSQMSSTKKVSFWLCAAFIAGVIVFSGCGGDSQLVGKWEIESSYYPPRDFIVPKEMEFFSDGKGRMTFDEHNLGTLPLTWTSGKGNLNYEIIGQFHVLDYEIKGSNLKIFWEKNKNSYSLYKKSGSKSSYAKKLAKETCDCFKIKDDTKVRACIDEKIYEYIGKCYKFRDEFRDEMENCKNEIPYTFW